MVPFADRIGRIGTLGLCTFGKAYMTPGHDPDDVNLDARAGSIIELFFNLLTITFNLPSVLGV